MTEHELIEAVVGAHRERSPDGAILPHPAWHDLDDAGRIAAFDATVQSRAIEAALAPDGLSTTARAVLARVRAGRGP